MEKYRIISNKIIKNINNRRLLLKKLDNNFIYISSSNIQNKYWRQKQEWYINGKHNECEKYQKELFYKITGKNIKNRTHIRIYKNNLVFMSEPFRNIDSFEYSEDFDGYFQYNNNDFYVNLKFICDDGGSQIRTLKLVYNFIKDQTQIKDNNKYFINILDGDTCYKYMNKINYLSNKQIFIGDMKQFKIWWFNNFK